LWRQVGQAAFEGIEAVAQGRAEPPAGLGQGHAPDFADEQGQAQGRFEKPDLMADRGRRHPEFGCGPAEAEITRGRLEGPRAARGGRGRRCMDEGAQPSGEQFAFVSKILMDDGPPTGNRTDVAVFPMSIPAPTPRYRLHIDSSARPGLSGRDRHGSHTRRLSRRFVDRWSAL